MNIIGSHNSMTYQDSKSWYGFLLKPFSKCQDHSIIDTIKEGCKAFDIRLCMRNGKWHFIHGLYLMDEVTDNFWSSIRYDIIRYNNRGSTICLRIILEDLKEGIPAYQLDYIYKQLESLVERGKLHNRRIIPYAGYLKDNLEYRVWDFSKFSEGITINEFQYVSSIKGWGIFPRLWTRLHRKSLRDIFRRVVKEPEIDIQNTINIYYFDFLYSIIYS